MEGIVCKLMYITLILSVVSVADGYWHNNLSHRHQKKYLNKHLYHSENMYRQYYQDGVQQQQLQQQPQSSSKSSRFKNLDKLYDRLQNPAVIQSTTEISYDEMLLGATSYKFNDLVTSNTLDELTERPQIYQQKNKFDLESEQNDNELIRHPSSTGASVQDKTDNDLITRSVPFNRYRKYNRTRVLVPDTPSAHFKLIDQSNNPAIQHIMKMKEESVCKTPRPKVVKVKDVFKDSDKTYQPTCTVLHQCGDDSGCCNLVYQICRPAKTELVELYFLISSVGSNETRIGSLKFSNHTECECQNKSSPRTPRDQPDQQLQDQQQQQQQTPSCQCPSEFAGRTLSNGHCVCDCYGKQMACIRLKRGRKYFDYQDRLCIETNQCHLPKCEYGPYIRSYSRCPKKPEQFTRWPRYSVNRFTK